MRTIFLVLSFLLALSAISTRNDTAGTASLVYEQKDNSWFEGDLTHLVVSQDAQWALFRRMQKVHLISLKTAKEENELLTRGLDQVEDAAFCGEGRLARRGKRGSQKGWFLPDGNNSQWTTLPEDAELTCSRDGKTLAFYHESKPADGIFIGSLKLFKSYRLKGEVTGISFAPDGGAVYAVFNDEAGVTSLARIALADGSISMVTTGLDMMFGSNSIGFSADGGHVYLALASADVPDNEARHRPNASRWLGIYDLDLTSADHHPVVVSEQDNYDPNFSSHSLYWARRVTYKAVAVVSAEGGDVRELLADAELPIWSPDGRRISYTFCRDRMADGALPMDAGVIQVNGAAEQTSAPSAIVSGYHEDFTPAWSPDGRWIAYHSHRSPTPVPFYSSPGHTDDIYLRRAEDTHAPEIRLTDFGWEAGPAYWSPDGRTLMFSSWVKNGQPGIDKVWLIKLDPETGRVLGSKLLPLSPAIHSAQWTAWSPDGREIAVEDNEGEQNRSIWIVRSDGSGARKLIDYSGTTYDGLDWTPDGKNIVYSGLSGDRMQLFSVPRAGGPPRQLTHDSGNLFQPRVSPDGRWIACSKRVRSEQILRQAM